VPSNLAAPVFGPRQGAEKNLNARPCFRPTEVRDRKPGLLSGLGPSNYPCAWSPLSSRVLLPSLQKWLQRALPRFKTRFGQLPSLSLVCLRWQRPGPCRRSCLLQGGGFLAIDPRRRLPCRPCARASRGLRYSPRIPRSRGFSRPCGSQLTLDPGTYTGGGPLQIIKQAPPLFFSPGCLGDLHDPCRCCLRGAALGPNLSGRLTLPQGPCQPCSSSIRTQKAQRWAAVG